MGDHGAFMMELPCFEETEPRLYLEATNQLDISFVSFHEVFHSLFCRYFGNEFMCMKMLRMVHRKLQI